jgi:hypothetical protein
MLPLILLTFVPRGAADGSRAHQAAASGGASTAHLNHLGMGGQAADSRHFTERRKKTVRWVGEGGDQAFQRAHWIERQGSQDSQTKDSGIDTSSTFTSSEDSSRGADLPGRRGEVGAALPALPPPLLELLVLHAESLALSCVAARHPRTSGVVSSRCPSCASMGCLLFLYGA